MRIRTQLILVFLALGVLPLSGVVLYSYVSSFRAVRAAEEAEAAEIAERMEERLAAIRDELAVGFETLDAPTLLRFVRGEVPELEPVARGLFESFGEVVPFIEALEFVPAAPEPPDPPGGEASPAPESDEPGALVIDVAALLAELRATEALREEIEAGVETGLLVGVQAATAVGQEVVESLSVLEALDAEEVDAEAIASWAESLGRRIESRMEVEGERLERLGQRIEASVRRRANEEERRARVQKDLETRRLLGRRFEIPVVAEGVPGGSLRARVDAHQVLRSVLGAAERDAGEIPFAVDADGRLHTASDDDRQALGELAIDFGAMASEAPSEGELGLRGEWVVVTTKDDDSGLLFGIARPVSGSLAALRRTTARNFGLGLGVVGLALFGVAALARRMSREVEVVTAGAERVARGDLEVRLPIRSKNELGTLAAAFNRMATDLGDHQRQLVEQERRRQEQEVAQAVLRAEYERKSEELEEARRFQLALLPKTLPEHPAFEVAVHMQTATEVGGDYYDFHLDDGILTIAVGDATGHGAKAGTMVTAIKSLFIADAAGSRPAEFLQHASSSLLRMELGRMAMGLVLARLEGHRLILSAAGMPPAYLYRASDDEVEELAIEGMPLGGLAMRYVERERELASGDTLLLMSDGFPELLGPKGDPLGYARTLESFRSTAGAAPATIVEALARRVAEWNGGEPPNDDVTFVVIRMR